MTNYNLTAADCGALNTVPNADQLTRGTDSFLQQIIAIAKRVDRRAQVFFDAQASTRSRKTEKTAWGFERHEAF